MGVPAASIRPQQPLLPPTRCVQWSLSLVYTYIYCALCASANACACMCCDSVCVVGWQHVFHPTPYLRGPSHPCVSTTTHRCLVCYPRTGLSRLRLLCCAEQQNVVEPHSRLSTKHCRFVRPAGLWSGHLTAQHHPSIMWHHSLLFVGRPLARLECLPDSITCHVPAVSMAAIRFADTRGA